MRGLLLFFLRCFESVVTPWMLAGTGPGRPPTFLLRQKGDPKTLPFGGVAGNSDSIAVRLRNGLRLQAQTPSPKKWEGKAGSAETRLRLKHLRFFFRLALPFFGSVSRGFKNHPFKGNLSFVDFTFSEHACRGYVPRDFCA